MLFQFLGGLGLFLFSIKYMGDGLQKSAGNRLRDMLDRYTTNPVMGVLVGILVTVLMQSSSGTTVITVGLVSAGFMTLRQAIGVIMGANVGTTITAFIIGFDIGQFAYPLLAIGAVLLFFFKKNTVQNIGQIIFGLGGLFVGLELMSSGMKPLQELSSFMNMALHISEHSILGVIFGTIVTLVVQSSSATVGILQGLYGEGLMPLQGALPILFGDNIGTTITAVLASIGASVAARRAAATHVLFNVVGTFIFLLILPQFTLYIEWLAGVFGLESKMQIAFAHGTFNVVNTMIQLPLIGVWVYIVTKVIPGEDSGIEYKPRNLDPHFIETSPAIAIGQAKEEILRMGEYSVRGLEETFEYLKTGDKKYATTTLQYEEAINSLDKKITDYLVKVSVQPLSDTDSARHHVLLENVRDIERIGDHFENIVELIDYKAMNGVQLSELSITDLSEMFTLTIETVQKAILALDTSDHGLAMDVTKKEELIDQMERTFRKKHIHRLNLGECSAHAGIVFTDIVSNLERIGDHAVNIADAILEKH
ncbi:Na/Pi cotransporter family protein [Viridibacillus sp. YIM B01967]|uniref:Na/Pi cotransporter family protein n=2 Tax=Viridibacillus soli TaxID=2798301 RepID=A0ABS1H1I1_9BACL|nr:Na/Pi cotransporter family protein [Viridibacillus soli]